MSDPVATYADDLAALVFQVKALVEWTASLRDLRLRGRLTKVKRTKLTELAAGLDELKVALDGILREPVDDEARAMMQAEHERFLDLLKGENR